MNTKPKKKFNWKIWGPVIGGLLLIGFILNLTGYETQAEQDRQAQAVEQEAQAAADKLAADEKKAEREAKASARAEERAAEKAAKEAEKAAAEAERKAILDSYLPEDEFAAKVEANWLEGLGGISSFQARLGSSDTLIGYISQIKPIDQNTVRVTVQYPAAGVSGAARTQLKQELETVARGCLNLGGYEFPQLERCEVETSDVEIIESLNR